MLAAVTVIHAKRLLPPPGEQSLAHPARGSDQCGGPCGTGRWLVKTLSDTTRDHVNLTPVPTTVAALVALPNPGSWPEAARLAPVEFTTYQVQAYLVGWHHAKDGDIHLILQDPGDQRATLIAEIPSPACAGACASRLAARYSEARAAFAELLHRPNPAETPRLLRVTGVGFFDRPHGQLGAARNCIELHPVLALTAP